MQLLKTLSGLFLLFIIGILLIGILLPKKEIVVFETDIKCDPPFVFNQVNNLKNWENWSVWHTLDTSMQITYSDSPSGVGAYYHWIGNKDVGVGGLEITKSVPDNEINYLMRFEDYDPAMVEFIISPNQTGSHIKWTMEVKQPKNILAKFFLGGYQYLFANKFISKDYQKSISRLENLCSQ